jgi:hypothetical protein
MVYGDVSMKVAINRCYGGFDLSDEAFEMYLNLKNIPYERVKARYPFANHQYDFYKEGHANDSDHLLFFDTSYFNKEARTDSALIEVIETLKEDANGWAAELKVVDVPDDVEWQIAERDGLEWVEEKHRTWY